MQPTTEVKGAERRGADERGVDLPVLAGISGTMRVDVKGQPAASVHVENGRIWMGKPDDPAQAVVVFEDRADFDRIASGELNAVVAALQGRLALQGDPELGMRVMAALNAARPFARKEA
jgi:putative sterol carrier protein